MGVDVDVKKKIKAEKRKIREKMRELVFDLLDTIQNAK